MSSPGLPWPGPHFVRLLSYPVLCLLQSFPVPGRSCWCLVLSCDQTLRPCPRLPTTRVHSARNLPTPTPKRPRFHLFFCLGPFIGVLPTFFPRPRCRRVIQTSSHSACRSWLSRARCMRESEIDRERENRVNRSRAALCVRSVCTSCVCHPASATQRV